jgi:type II secretory pathway pseudopilin PulG
MHDQHRTAFTIIETTAAAAVLAAILSAVVPMLLLVHAQQREITLHRRALQVADNLLERVLAHDPHVLPTEEIHVDPLGGAIQADDLMDMLPGSAWDLSVTEQSEPISVRRITVSLSYRVQGRTESVQLTAWAFDRVQSDKE